MVLYKCFTDFNLQTNSIALIQSVGVEGVGSLADVIDEIALPRSRKLEQLQ